MVSPELLLLEDAVSTVVGATVVVAKAAAAAAVAVAVIMFLLGLVLLRVPVPEFINSFAFVAVVIWVNVTVQIFHS